MIRKRREAENNAILSGVRPLILSRGEWANVGERLGEWANVNERRRRVFSVSSGRWAEVAGGGDKELSRCTTGFLDYAEYSAPLGESGVAGKVCGRTLLRSRSGQRHSPGGGFCQRILLAKNAHLCGHECNGYVILGCINNQIFVPNAEKRGLGSFRPFRRETVTDKMVIGLFPLARG